MAGEFFQFGMTQTFKDKEKEKKVYGVTSATVIANVDCTGEARVQLRLPWLPGYEPWARVSTPMAGMARGTFFIPQIGDEVLVSFNHGDVREPFIIGSLWNTMDRPPALAPTDAVTKRIIRTPLGQEVAFDETLQSVTISNTTKQSLTLDPLAATLDAGIGLKATITLDVKGGVSIKGATSITLDAPLIEIKGTIVSVAGKASAKFDGGASCTIAGATIDIG